jgi:biotin operon repressor
MPIQQTISRIIYLDSLIRTQTTGGVKQVAKKMRLSEPSILKYISTMKALGCPIKFCRKRKSYYYTSEGDVIISFFRNKSEMKISRGGGKYNPVSFFC